MEKERQEQMAELTDLQDVTESLLETYNHPETYQREREQRLGAKGSASIGLGQGEEQ